MTETPGAAVTEDPPPADDATAVTAAVEVNPLEDDDLPDDEDAQASERIEEDEVIEEADGALDDDEDLGEDEVTP